MTEMIWKGAEPLREYLIPVSSVVPHERNPRRGKIELIAASLERFGQVRPILIREGVVQAGNHTLLAARQNGWTHIAAVPHEFVSQAEADAYLLADNHLAEIGDYRHDVLIQELERLEASGAWEGSGFDCDYLDDLRALHDRTPLSEHATFHGGYAATAEELADKQARLGAGQSYREVVLSLPADEADAFDLHVAILRREYGDGISVTDAVVHAIHAQAQ